MKPRFFLCSINHCTLCKCLPWAGCVLGARAEERRLPPAGADTVVGRESVNVRTFSVASGSERLEGLCSGAGAVLPCGEVTQQGRVQGHWLEPMGTVLRAAVVTGGHCDVSAVSGLGVGRMGSEKLPGQGGFSSGGVSWLKL